MRFFVLIFTLAYVSIFKFLFRNFFPINFIKSLKKNRFALFYVIILLCVRLDSQMNHVEIDTQHTGVFLELNLSMRVFPIRSFVLYSKEFPNDSLKLTTLKIRGFPLRKTWKNLIRDSILNIAQNMRSISRLHDLNQIIY